MASATRLSTRRLELVACSVEAARASLEGPAALERLLHRKVPETWPPEELVDVLVAYARDVERDPSHLGWGLWLVLRRRDGALVGSAGFKGKPDASLGVEIGYGIEPQARRRGYASEAVAALIGWAWTRGARRVVAECDPHNVASIGVLRGVGMRRLPAHGRMLWWEIRAPI
jgi:[ribosomal protein S5]-alanine N-acetyltransferase